MNMFKRLFKLQMSGFFGRMFSKGRKEKSKGKMILFALLLVYVLGYMAFFFGMTFWGICLPLSASGLDWLYFAVAGLLSFSFCFLLSVFSTESQLYEAKDNELLLAMPIKPSAILASRMAVVLLWTFLLELMVLGPAAVVYGIQVGFSVLGIVGTVVVFLTLPLLVMVFSCIFGWLLALLNARAKRKNIATMVFSLALMAFYMIFFTRLNEYSQSLLLNSESIADGVQGGFFPLYYLGRAMAGTDVLSILLFLLCVLLPFALTCWLLSRGFRRVLMTKRGQATVRYRERAMKTSSPQWAFVKKELARFTSSPLYMLNAALGLLFTLIAGVALIIKGQDLLNIIQTVPELADYLAAILVLALCVLATTNTISAPSVSLEGQSLWLAKSLPLSGSKILLAKAYLHMLLCLPVSLLVSLICAIVFKLGLLDSLLVVLLPALLTTFQALLGVVANLRFHRFDWVNETVPIKQSLSVAICLLGDFALLGAVVAVYLLLLQDIMPPRTMLLIFGLLLALACGWMYRYLSVKGEEKFAALE